MKFYICLALLIYVSRASNLRAIEIREEVGGSINTSSGAVNGHAASNATSVSEYLGIPYAQPPIGELRFAPPQRYNGSSTINGTDFVGPFSGRSKVFLTCVRASRVLL